MCELLGLTSNAPIEPQQLLRRFGARGGDVADNPDGWGLARLVAGAFRIDKEPQAAARSKRFRALCAKTRSSLLLAHVRKANPPTARISANTHPFSRRCCGREWIFAHNGIVPDAAELSGTGPAQFCAPAGDTDSEHAFCVVLDRIAAAFSSARPNRWFDALARTAELLASQGRFNFLMSDGVHLVAYGHDRLHSLVDTATACRCSAATRLAVVATEPLTDPSEWRAFAPGELRVYRAGLQIAHFITRPHVVDSARTRSAGRPSIEALPS